jgi:hypothetical protein
MYRPEVQATLEKYRLVKPGMTRAQVYAIRPPRDIFQRLGAETEVWHFSSPKGDVMRIATIDIAFAGGRARKITRDVENMRLGLMKK